MPVMYDDYNPGESGGGGYDDDAWGRPWGHPDYGKDPTDPQQDLTYPAPGPSVNPDVDPAPPPPPPPPPPPEPDDNAVPDVLTDWFMNNPPPADFGAVPAPFGETYSQLERPAHLASPYVAPEWTESFAEPDLPSNLQTPWAPPDWQTFLEDPGVKAALAASQRGHERSAAAKGSILSGGSQVALGRRLQDEVAGQYGAATDRSLTTRNQQIGEFQTNRGNAFANYQQRYGAFVGNRDAGMAARNVNENAFQSDTVNHRNQYLTRYQSYLDTIGHKRNAEGDWWDRGMDLSRLGLDATTAGGGA